MTPHAPSDTNASTGDTEPHSTSDDPPERSERAGVFLVDIETAPDLPRDEMARWVAEHLRRIARHLGIAGEYRIRFVSDPEMIEAHRRYLDLDGTTDVLTFDLSDGASADGAPIDADVLVCVDEADRRAKELGHGVERELLLYALHGLLHCLGHDDHDAPGYERMHELEDRLLEAVGIGATFAPGRDGVEPGA